MDAIDIQQHINHLERIRMQYAPFKYLKKFVHSTMDIYKERHLLKTVSFDHKSILYIVNLIVDDLIANKRFRRMECLKILKRMIKNRASQEDFSNELSKSLFYLYQNFILTGSEEIQWAVSAFIKDQPLEEECIRWLLDHYEVSEHIVNRLLRYPTRNKLITDWAYQVLEAKNLENRISEVIGILIDDDIPEDIQADPVSLMWSIYYCKCKKTQKRNLIIKHLDVQNYSAALEVAERLGIGEVSKVLLKHYRGLLKGIDD